ncbi:MAG: FTR1 family protein [Deltaproteobacteria bacterium]|nr:FTR1 family protein [Deltaproteobacteria bacterium]
MLAGILITLREGMEAFLVVGILLSYLRRMGAEQFRRYVWFGTTGAVLLSIALTVVLHSFALELEGHPAHIFEIVVALLAVVVLSWMVVWMQRQAKTIKSDLEAKAQAAITNHQLYALSSLAFVSVLREGLETSLFLSALIGPAGKTGVLPGAFLGLLLAAILSYLVFKALIKVNLRIFFISTGLLLILIASGLLAHTVMAFREMGTVPGIWGQVVWNTNSIIDEEGFLGRVLHALIGYDGDPVLLETIFYFGYLALFGGWFLREVKKPARV